MPDFASRKEVLNQFKAVNETKGCVLAERLMIANTLVKRLRGLLGRSSLSPEEGLLLAPCNAVHSCFMRFPFDAVFLDSDGCVVKVIHEMLPFRFSPVVRRAVAVLELSAGTVRMTGTQVGDRIRFDLKGGAGYFDVL